MPDKTTPPAPNPSPGHQPGYAEPQPRDPGDARQPGPRKPPNPDDGGLTREPESVPDPASKG